MTLVNRHFFSITEAVAALLPDGPVDCERFEFRVNGGMLEIDVVAPAKKAKRTDIDPEKKGGPLAKRAAILCGERGFLTFMEAANADEAKAAVLAECRIGSRAELDHNKMAAELWDEISMRYDLWLQGY